MSKSTKKAASAKSKAPKKLAVGLVVDRSGSMRANWPKTVDALNEYLSSLKADTVDANVTVVAFDSSSIDTVRKDEPAASCAPITTGEFPPRGMTPLYDAVGRTIETLSLRPKRTDEGVALVVMTDGLENASSDYTLEKLKTLLAEKQDKENWLVIFLGEGLSAWAQGAATGVYAGNTAQYRGDRIGVALRASSAATMAYASTNSNDVGATFQAFRDEMVGDDKPKDSKQPPAAVAKAALKTQAAARVRSASVKKW